MIVRKNMAELEKMRAAGLLVWKILDTLRHMVKEGITTYDLEIRNGEVYVKQPITKKEVVPPPKAA